MRKTLISAIETRLEPYEPTYLNWVSEEQKKNDKTERDELEAQLKSVLLAVRNGHTAIDDEGALDLLVTLELLMNETTKDLVAGGQKL